MVYLDSVAVLLNQTKKIKNKSFNIQWRIGNKELINSNVLVELTLFFLRLWRYVNVPNIGRRVYISVQICR